MTTSIDTLRIGDIITFRDFNTTLKGIIVKVLDDNNYTIEYKDHKNLLSSKIINTDKMDVYYEGENFVDFFIAQENHIAIISRDGSTREGCVIKFKNDVTNKINTFEKAGFTLSNKTIKTQLKQQVKDILNDMGYFEYVYFANQNTIVDIITEKIIELIIG